MPPSPSSDACSWRSSTPSPPLSEGGSTSTFWSQVTTDEGIVIDDYDELPRKKKVSTVSCDTYSSPANFVTTARSKRLGFDEFRVEFASLLVATSAFLGVFRRSLLPPTLYFYNQHIDRHCTRFVAFPSRPPPSPTTHTAEV